MSAIDHVRHLAEGIGPRGSTTLDEAAAADYVFGALERIGLRPVKEPFRSARSAWAPYSLFWGLAICGGLAFMFGGRVGAIAGLSLSVIALGSVLLEMLFRPNPLRWILPTGGSQNVWARLEPSGGVRSTAVVVAHLDTHRTPLVFSSDAWVRLFEKLVPIGLGCTIVLIVLFALGIPYGWPALRFAALAPMLMTAGMLIVTLQGDFTPHTAGANDNASGVGVALALAERLAEEPLSHTSVWILLTGCEEVGCYGADAFLRTHRGMLGDAAWLSIDTVGGKDARPVHLTKERFLATTRSNRMLIGLAEGVGARHPELEVRPIEMAGAYTEGAIGAKHGLRVLTFESQTRNGTLPEWHRPTDTIENLSEEAVRATEAFVWETLQALDGLATRQTA
jgi:hypothetical protein